MATKKKMLQAAAGNAGGEALNVEDVFSTYLYTGNARSTPVENGVKLGQSFGSGSAEFDGTDASGLEFADNAALQFGTGDYCLECWVWARTLTNTFGGIIAKRDSSGSYFRLTYENSTEVISYNDGSATVQFSFTTGNLNSWVHLAVTKNGTTLRIFKDGVLQDTASSTQDVSYAGKPLRIGALTGSSSDYAWHGYIAGVRAVKGNAVYTTNFTPSTTPLTDITGTGLLTAQGDTPLVDTSSNGFTPSVTGAKAAIFGPFDGEEAGEGGLVWVKGRSRATSHVLDDTERGVNSNLSTDLTDGEAGRSTVTSFNSNGFTAGSYADINEGTDTYASWTFRKAPRFFDVVTVTAPASGTLQVPHNLGCEVGFFVIKSTSDSDNWVTYHRQLGVDKYLFLNLDNAQANSTGIWSDVTDSYFTLRVGQNCTAGRDYVVYLFAHNDGDGEFGPDGDADIIKCGSYTGNGSTDGPEIDLGFEPQWVMIKASDNAGNWILLDSMRGIPTDGLDSYLLPNQSGSEVTSQSFVNLTSTGFKIVTTNSTFNTSGGDYIYIAIRRGTKVPESGTEVFDVEKWTGDDNENRILPLSMTPDAAFNAYDLSNAGGEGQRTIVYDRLRGTPYLQTDSTAVEGTNSLGFIYFDQMDGVDLGNAGGFSKNDSGYDHVGYYWKRAPNFFDVVAYAGDGTAGRTVSHNLGVAPEMMWVKARDRADAWSVYHADLGPTLYLSLEATDAAETGTAYWNDTSPTDSVFTLGIEYKVNRTPHNYIAYLFASLDGVSKVGSYTGNGTSQTIDCGFTSGARFVLLKRTDSTGDWMIYDSTRGITSTSNDPALALNNTDAEFTENAYFGADVIRPHSSGFIIDNYFSSNGHTYIFYAIA